MKFSVIVIAFNQKATICAAISSALEQTYRDIEVIYVDDASTDGSLAAVKAHFADSRLRVIEHRENQGCVISRLDGAACASGDWVMFLDGDDTLREDACAVLEKTIRSSQPEVDNIGFGVELLCTASVEENAKNEIRQLVEQPYLGYASGRELMEELYLKRNKAWLVCNKCYSYSLIQKVLAVAKREKIVHLEDFYLSFLICDLTERYLGIPQQLYRYVFGSGISVSKKLSYDAFLRYLSSVKSPELAAEYAKSRGLFDQYRSVFDAVTREVMIGSYYRLRLISDEDKQLAAWRYMETFGATLEKTYYDLAWQTDVAERGQNQISLLEDALQKRYKELDECRTYIRKLEQDIQARDKELDECRAYMRKLEQDIQAKDRALDECRAYIRKLESHMPR